MATWRSLERAARDRLGDEREARWIVQRAAGLDGGGWLAALDDEAPRRVEPFIEGMVDRRLAGEPLQYVLGRWSFRRLELYVDRRVLIPRPETEQVVEVALAELTRLRIATGHPPTVADLGTGSGAIALSIAVEVAGAAVWATDESEGALGVAGANLAGIGGLAATRVRLAHGDWFGALPEELRGRLDLVVSNPPYVAEDEVADLDPAVADWEPRGALVAGPAGTEDLEALVAAAPAWLGRPGALVLELAPHQAEAVAELARAAGAGHVAVHRDLAGRERTLVARWDDRP